MSKQKDTKTENAAAHRRGAAASGDQRKPSPPSGDANPTHREDFTSFRRGSEKACTRRLNIAQCECRIFRR